MPNSNKKQCSRHNISHLLYHNQYNKWSFLASLVELAKEHGAEIQVQVIMDALQRFQQHPTTIANQTNQALRIRVDRF